MLLSGYARRTPDPVAEEAIERANVILARCPAPALQGLAIIVKEDPGQNRPDHPASDSLFYIKHAYNVIGREGGINIFNILIALVPCLPSPPPLLVPAGCHCWGRKLPQACLLLCCMHAMHAQARSMRGPLFRDMHAGASLLAGLTALAQMHYPLMAIFPVFFYLITLGPFTRGFRHDADRVMVGVGIIGAFVTSHMAVWVWTSCMPEETRYMALNLIVMTFTHILTLLNAVYRNPSVDSYTLRPVQTILADYRAALRVILAAAVASYLK
jgi:hypothetical protein